MRYEVQMLIADDWSNVWSEDGEPLTFATQGEAQDSLDDHLTDAAEAFKAGHLTDAPIAADFRIAPVQ